MDIPNVVILLHGIRNLRLITNI